MDSYSINPNFKTENFNNSISDFNKFFNSNYKNSLNKTDNYSNFDEVFNSMGKKPLSANISINVNKNKAMSPVEKTVSDIGNGFINSLNDLNNIQKKAEDDLETFASGGDISVHDVMISSQKSSLSMQMAIQVRNRILSAYNDFKSMNV